MTELLEQRMNSLKVRKVVGKIRGMKLVAIRIEPEHIRNDLINENIRSLVAPHFDQAESNHHNPAFGNSTRDGSNQLTPTQCLVEIAQLKCEISVRIIKGPIPNMNNAVKRELSIRIECPAQLVVNRKRIVLIGKA